MFFSSGIRGNDLPPKTVCLTFDDGPGETEGPGVGPRTLELAQFLSSRDIPAAFFTIGEFAAPRKEILNRMAGMGHLIGNHTYNHTRLAAESGTFAADQIGRTDRVLSGVSQPLKCFRPPHGRWSPKVAGELNWTEVASHIGPILWDIDAADWRFWLEGGTAEECALSYIARIQAVGSGVIIMHDSSFEAEIRVRNNTFEALKSIVDWLAQNGYSFVRLDSIPQVREASRVSYVVALETAAGQYISAVGGGGREVTANAPVIGGLEGLGVVDLAENRIALRCLSGHYVSIQEGAGGAVLANATRVGHWEVLTRVDLGKGRIALRCRNGDYLSAQSGDAGGVLANSSSITASEVFREVRFCTRTRADGG